MSDWQPIDTAPRDGSMILLYWANKVRFGYYLDNTKTGLKPWAGWKVPSMMEWPTKEQPTHWMPLPKSPE